MEPVTQRMAGRWSQSRSAWQADRTLQPSLEKTWFHHCSFHARTSSSVHLIDDAIPSGGDHVPWPVALTLHSIGSAAVHAPLPVALAVH